MGGTNKILFAIFGSFLLGIFIRSLYTLPLYSIYILLLLAFAYAVVGFAFKKKYTHLFLVSVFLFGTTLGVLRYAYDAEKVDTLSPLLNKSVILKGVITEEPDYREKTTRLVVEIKNDSNEKDRVLITTLPPMRYSYGEELEIKGSLKKPQNFETANGRIFNYEAYLAKSGIFYEMTFPRITVTGEGRGNSIKRNLFALKQKFLEGINKVIATPESSFLGGILLGGNQSLPKDVQQSFRNAGLVHIIVLSGYNITIVAAAFMFLFSFLSIRKRIFFGVLGILLFAIMTGGSATVVRASVMATLALIATFIRRDYDITRALILAGVVMVFINPKILVFDLSFQLSFLSTVGLIYVAPIFEHYLSALPQKWGFREIVVATLSTQLFVLPFILYSIGTFSVVALIANLLVLPLIPLTMLFGFITGVCAFVSTTIATPVAYLTYYFLHYEMLVAERFGNLPFASFAVPSFPVWIMCVSYVGFGFLLWYLQKRNTPALAGV
jgi:competence protein ComEC